MVEDNKCLRWRGIKHLTNRLLDTAVNVIFKCLNTVGFPGPDCSSTVYHCRNVYLRSGEEDDNSPRSLEQQRYWETKAIV